ncbi:cell division topological specificity factor MinE [Pseudooceanicola sp. CBS1P-1]|uniref:Cell division topological specificity factor n=1 Tax=Pseudooceanicola albus TaxID=2692189 RepID=A0A6L7FZX1_9RHOB|nr:MULTISPECIES: cell division topological specificity factor MinE [Pseudooceanicola]MBT9382441.1 cell division topological specificity factor MinE [Pseudooceanicola endophyticus]MXN16982.1 cell division topological specificity factor MinE [Pseudooceanicola albus]
MSLFGFSFKPRKKGSAETAKDRLQILLAHERSSGSGTPDYLPQLQRDIIEVVKKYIQVEQDDVEIRMERGNELSSLEINIEVPSGKPKEEAAKA